MAQSIPIAFDTIEYAEVAVPAELLNDEDLNRASNSGMFSVSRSLGGQHYLLSSRGWVGQIPVSDGVMVRVAPKVPIANLFWMLEVAYAFEFKLWTEAVSDVDSLPEIYVRLALIFARKVNDRLRRGAFRQYVDLNENLQVVRGRINVAESIRRLAVSPVLACDYQEQTPDIDDNQIVLYALELLLRSGIENLEAATAVRKARNALIGNVTLRTVGSSECVGRQYNRLNDDYRTLHALARFFIDHVGPSFARGDRKLLPFAIYMPGLFENFVVEWLRKYGPTNYQFIRQFRLHLDSNLDLEMSVDILVNDGASGSHLAVLDTKYKMTERPSREDVSQIVLYAAQTGVRKALLVYPWCPSKVFRANVRDISVKALVLDLAAHPRPDCEGFLQTLLAEIYEK